MRTKQKELGWTTMAFFPDVTAIKNHEESEEEALSRHLHRAKPLLIGALGILTAAGDGRCDHCIHAEELLTSYIDAAEMGKRAFNEVDVHNQPSFVTLDELGKMLGDRGWAEVTIRLDNTGFENNQRLRIGRDYRVNAKEQVKDA